MAKKKKTEKPQREYTRRQISHLKKQRRRQHIVFYGGIAIIAAVILIVLIGWLMADFVPLHKTAIKVNDTDFNVSYYIDMLKIARANQPDQNIQSLISNVTGQIEQGELMRQGARNLGITVTDEETRKALEDMGAPVTDAYIGLWRDQLLRARLKDEYFEPLVPESDNQVYPMIMLVESEDVADSIISRLQSGDNFTALAEEYAQNYYSKNVNKGDFGWHPRSILMDQLGSSIPVDYAFTAEVGALSDPLFDEDAYMQLGYWLLRVNDRPADDSANVSALLISSQELAEDVRARLEAGEDLGPIADELSNYSPSREKHGELGIMLQSDNISDPFNGYVFNPETLLGEWSEPLRDEKFWSRGAYWLVKVVDRDNDRKLSDEDRTHLIDKSFEDWVSALWSIPGNVVDDSNLTPELMQWIIERATEDT